MRLQSLFAEAEPDVEITDLAYDNRAVVPGALFFCVRGFTRDGHRFAADAIARGAAALVVDHRLPELDVPQALAEDVRAAMAPAAAEFFSRPTDTLRLAGVTGTNGKTTIAYLLRAILAADGTQTGLLGTVKNVIAGIDREVSRTTSEAIDLQRNLRAMLDGGDRAATIEVSSHALSLHRVDGCRFAAAIFTNLTQDHLDFHRTMEEYFQAKRRLFTALAPAVSVINVDDEYGRRLAADPEVHDVSTYGLESADAGYRAGDVRTSLQGTSFTLHHPDGESIAVHSPLCGRFNVANVLAAITAARALGVDLPTVLAAVGRSGQVPGRFETVDEGQPFAVLVDYAHTPDSLANVLETARGLTDGKLRVVFGCGGDRDRGKRPLMGEIAARLADDVIVTSDNPRSEQPQAIIDEILAGIDRPVAHEVDRRTAIAAGIAAAQAGDVVVIAGKGHEHGQEFAGGRKLPFDDVEVARELLRG
jgi:UDP-N-acetylmuramoyl-L-alanyl-D-glutamate--2,6-diaminopimelate ligase